jgi:hypothetical protein
MQLDRQKIARDHTHSCQRLSAESAPVCIVTDWALAFIGVKPRLKEDLC